MSAAWKHRTFFVFKSRGTVIGRVNTTSRTPWRIVEQAVINLYRRRHPGQVTSTNEDYERSNVDMYVGQTGVEIKKGYGETARKIKVFTSFNQIRAVARSRGTFVVVNGAGELIEFAPQVFIDEWNEMQRGIRFQDRLTFS